jgi:hypothetical protein
MLVTILKKTNPNAWSYQAFEPTFEHLFEKHNMAAIASIFLPA